MKRNLTFFMIVCFAILFTACHKESEGVYNPGKKISKTYYTAYNSDGTIEQPRHLSETYTWNKDNTLNNIESEWSRQSYTYYSNKRIKTYTYQSKVDGWSYTSEYKYKGNQLSEIKLSDGEIYQFTHKNGKIVTITYGVYNNDKNADKSKVSPLRFVLSEEICRDIQENIEMQRAKKVGKGSNTGTDVHVLSTYPLTWTKDNVTKMVYMDEEDGRTITNTYQYDSYNNPYYNSDYTEVYSLSKNNIISEKHEQGNSLRVITYTYTYEDQYPVRKQQSSQSYWNGSLMSESNNRLTEYEYLN